MAIRASCCAGPLQDFYAARVARGIKPDMACLTLARKIAAITLIKPGYNSNYGKRKQAAYIYLTGTLNAAIWAAELALGESPGRIYVVEATGPSEDDPNLTDKKYPGNPTLSYRSKDPLRVIGEVVNWRGHSAEELTAMKDGLERFKKLGVEATED